MISCLLHGTWYLYYAEGSMGTLLPDLAGVQCMSSVLHPLSVLEMLDNINIQLDGLCFVGRGL